MDKKLENWQQQNDILHWAKMYSGAPWQGYTEKLETAGKSITPALGLTTASKHSQMLARNFAHFLEYNKIAKVAKEVDVSLAEGMSRHNFFLEDGVINAIILAGCALAVITQPALLVPMLLVGVFYFGSDRVIKSLRKMA